MADSKKYIGIYDTLEDVQDALDNGQLSKPYVAKTMDNGQLDYNSLSPVDYSQYWCTYYPLDAKIWVKTIDGTYINPTEYTGGDGKIPKADFPDFYFAGSNMYNAGSTVTRFKYFPFDSTSATTIFRYAWYNCKALTSFPLIDTSNGVDFSNTWNGCSALTEFPMLDLHNGTDFEHAWQSCKSLTDFPLLDLSAGTTFYNAWAGCTNLVNLSGFGAISTDFDLADSTKLTVESLMNVINQAGTVTGKTMKLGSTNLAKLSDEQKAVATSKGWTLA